MDISPIGLACNWLPHVPSILKTAILATVGQSENASNQDALTETLVAAARPVLRTPAPLLKSQRQFLLDPGIFGRMWVAKYTVPVPPESVVGQTDSDLSIRQAVALAIEKLGAKGVTCEISDLVPIETEWTGYRASVSHLARRPSLSEREMYVRMMAELDDECPTILYFHGGAHCLMDPATHRWTTSSLARDCRGRVLSVRHRLSPQSVFPAALLDAFTAYLSLLAPPEGAFHRPVPARRLVLAGDSSGAGLAASLLLLLLTLNREETVVHFHGQGIRIPSPPCAGLAMTSPWFDVSRALPSTSKNARWDMVAPPYLDSASPPFPPDQIWPTSPPRAETYCVAHLVTHPLVSPLAATPEHWHGAPPVYMNLGWEVIQDEIEVFARRVYASSPDAIVVFDGYSGMPHCFCMFPWNQRGRQALARWGAFCHRVVTQRFDMKRTDVGTWTDKSLVVKEVRLDELGLTNTHCGYDRTLPLDDVTVEKLMAQSRDWRVGLEDAMLREWKGGSGSRVSE